jgi:hypothetical protein
MEYKDLMNFLYESCNELALWDVISITEAGLNNNTDAPLTPQTVESTLLYVEELLKSDLFYIGTNKIVDNQREFQRLDLSIDDILLIIRNQFKTDDYLPAKTGFTYYFQPSLKGKRRLRNLRE